MKVLHFYKRSLPQSFGGVESFIDTLCSTISKYDVTNDVLAISNKPPKKVIKYHNYNVHYAKENLYIASTSFSFNAIFSEELAYMGSSAGFTLQNDITADYFVQYGTQDQIEKVLEYLESNFVSHHIEVETYTWDVLPNELKVPITESIARELEWMKSRL